MGHRGRQPPDRLTDAACRRTRDTATKSANTSSSRSAWPRWTSSGRPRAVPAATERPGEVGGPAGKRLAVYICVCQKSCKQWTRASIDGNTLLRTLDGSASGFGSGSGSGSHPRQIPASQIRHRPILKKQCMPIAADIDEKRPEMCHDEQENR